MKYLIFAFAIFQVGCSSGMSASKGELSSVSISSGDPGLQAFASGFYAFAKSQGCVACHGSTQNPRFALSDVNAAYANALPLLNVGTPANSIFVLYAGNGHCSVAACSNPNVRPQVVNFMTSWAAGEDSGGGGPTPTGAQYFTGSLAVPANTPLITESANPAVLRFKLMGVKPSLAATNNANAAVEIEIFKLSANQYRISRVKIVGNTQSVMVRGIHVYIKAASESGVGHEDVSQGLGWNDVNATAAAFTGNIPANAPAGATPLSNQSIQMQSVSTMDVLTVGFEDLQ